MHMHAYKHAHKFTVLYAWTVFCARAQCSVLMPEYVYIYSKCTALVKKRTHTLLLWPFLVSVARIKERCTDKFVLRWRMLAIAFTVTLHRGKDPTVQSQDFSQECVVHIFRGWGVIWYCKHNWKYVYNKWYIYVYVRAMLAEHANLRYCPACQFPCLALERERVYYTTATKRGK